MPCFCSQTRLSYAGDKSHVGVLKALITEPTLTVEAKYQNAVQAPNFVHLMMASNEDWVVPASLDARRFLVLLVAATKVRNRAYFTAIWQEMESGGYEAMLHDLLHHDLTGFDVRDVPDTEGLQEQKKLSLGTSQAWWFDALHRGYVYKSKLGLEQYFGEWREAETTEVLYASYSEFAKAQNERHPMAREAFGRFMVSMGGKASKPRNAVVGEHITDVVTNQYGDTARKAVVVRKERSHGYSLGDLKAARDAFTDATKLPRGVGIRRRGDVMMPPGPGRSGWKPHPDHQKHAGDPQKSLGGPGGMGGAGVFKL